MNIIIGSGDVKALLMGKHTKGYQDLFRKVFAEDSVKYNSLASPIDALRTGAILEDRYLLTLGEDYFTQYRVQSKEMDVLKASLDFAKLEKGEVVDFDELKTMWLPDYINDISQLDNADEKSYLPVIKKKKDYYNQVQQQLYCSGLNSCNLVFLSVDTYEDERNFQREIKESDYKKFRIKRDEEVISNIKERARIFQLLKDNFT